MHEPFAGLVFCQCFISLQDSPCTPPPTALPLTAILLLSACATNNLGDSRDLNKTGTGTRIVNMTSATGFDNLFTVLKPGYATPLKKIASVLNQYTRPVVSG